MNFADCGLTSCTNSPIIKGAYRWTKLQLQFMQRRNEVYMANHNIQELATKVKENVGKVIVGKEDVVDLIIIAMLCNGHILLEDVPGTGKTVLAKSLAASIDCKFSRIQFTPDLLPSDVTGINFFNMKESEFEFIPGPVFSNILLADEINRATPKTQSGLLECMEEHQVTIDGKTTKLSDLFMVIATQNPLENAGVFPLPEAQLDRFLIKMSMNYPRHSEGVQILKRFYHENPLETLKPVATIDDVMKCQEELKHIYIHDDVLSYIVDITESTRGSDSVALGASPRGSQSLMRVSQGFAGIAGRDYVSPDDVKKAAPHVLAHRLILKSSAKLEAGAAEAVIQEIVDKVPVPTEDYTN